MPDNRKIQQEQDSPIKILDSDKKIIVVNGDIKTRNNEQGITIMNIIDFLLDENSLDL